LRKTQSNKSHDYHDAIVYENLRFEKVFRPHENKKLEFSNSSGLMSVFEKPRFRDGLVYTVGLTVEIKLRFQISLCGLRLNGNRNSKQNQQHEYL